MSLLKACNVYYRMSTSDTGLATGYFFLREIPPPSEVVYKAYARVYDTSRGGAIQQGYYNVEILWQTLRPKQAYAIKQLVDAALATANKYLYLTIDRQDGTSPGRDWIDVYGYPREMEIVQKGPIVGSSGVAHENVRLFVNNLTVLNDPADFT